MAKENNVCLIPLISGDGEFDSIALETFSQKIKLDEHGFSYVVVSIIGAQSTGKSTLLNHLFGTNFREMDARSGRAQTTKGIWLAKAADIEPCTLIFDVEGIDGVEKKGDDTFEMQSALFALAMSDILIVNLGLQDVGRHKGGCIGLLETVFEVMMRFVNPRRRTLLFVIRDQTDETPLEMLTEQLQRNIQQTYNSVPKPEAYKETEISYFLDVRVTALPHFKHQRMEFNNEVVSLRQRFFIDFTLAGDQQDRVPASGITISAKELWQQIKGNEDIDLHANKTMVAAVRCNKIWKDRVTEFVESQGWIDVKETLKSTLVKDFGKKMTSFIQTCLSKYDEEASCYDEGVRREQRLILQDKLLQIVQPAYQTMLEYLHSRSFCGFKDALDIVSDKGEHLLVAAGRCRDIYLSEFREGCRDALIEQAKWDSSNLLDRLQRDMDAHITFVECDAQREAANKALKEIQASLKETEIMYQNAEFAAEVVAARAATAAAVATAERVTAKYEILKKAAADEAAAAEKRRNILIGVMIGVPSAIIGGAAVAVVGTSMVGAGTVIPLLELAGPAAAAVGTAMIPLVEAAVPGAATTLITGGVALITELCLLAKKHFEKK